MVRKITCPAKMGQCKERFEKVIGPANMDQKCSKQRSRDSTNKVSLAWHRKKGSSLECMMVASTVCMKAVA